MLEVWSDGEIDLIVADYFSMLGDELTRRTYSKAEHNRALQQVIQRSRGSIEYKHQNVSAVMLGLGQPWIEGYKPAANYQHALVDGVLRWLRARPDWLRPQETAKNTGSVSEASSLWIGPPPAQHNQQPLIDPDFIAAIGRKFDVAEHDARNRALGKAGEQVVLRHEQQVLRQANRDDLADKVRWTAVEDGDGFGFDIASFTPEGRERLIEVKTTNGWERTPFHISRNELGVADRRREEWCLLRLWNFSRAPKAFELRPPLQSYVELTPTTFQAHIL